MLTSLKKGGRGVGQLLTIDEKGGRGGLAAQQTATSIINWNLRWVAERY